MEGEHDVFLGHASRQQFGGNAFFGREPSGRNFDVELAVAKANVEGGVLDAFYPFPTDTM
jgi:hypothetical protein